MNELFSSAAFWTAVGAVAATGSALVAAIYTWLTHRLVRSSSEPNVVLYVRHDLSRPTILQLVVENIGRGLASDVRFEPSRPMPRHAFGIERPDTGAPVTPMTAGPFVKGIRTLGPGDSRVVDWGQFGGLSAALGPEPLLVVVRYKHGDKEMEPVSAYLEVYSYEGTVAHESETRVAVRALESIAKAVTQVANNRAGRG